MSDVAAAAPRRPTLDDVAEMAVRKLAELRDVDLEHLVHEARRRPEHVAADFVIRLRENRMQAPRVICQQGSFDPEELVKR